MSVIIRLCHSVVDDTVIYIANLMFLVKFFMLFKYDDGTNN